MPILLAVAALHIGALISIITCRAKSGMKFAWIAFGSITPVIGSKLWFIVGRRHTRGRT
ncbi:PLDc N-terminal domain-containing protein [Streptomyces sp. NPDC052115]|uniref:PLDc N-terminal domain-containing protein n=1 Tax=Streptomyces sp. NPDC052115 TaxID=3155794 RepID=UPI00342DD751